MVKGSKNEQEQKRQLFSSLRRIESFVSEPFSLSFSWKEKERKKVQEGDKREKSAIHRERTNRVS